MKFLLQATSCLILACGSLVASGCKPPKDGAQLNAIVSRDGGDAVSLIPGRRHFTTATRDPSFENSIRMVLMPVRCSAASVNKLELLSAIDPELIRHDGNRIVDLDGVAIPGAENCVIDGNYAVHPWAFSALFDGMPKTQDAYDSQQWVWLGLRGRIDANAAKNPRLPRGVEKMLAEAGLYQGVPQAVFAGKVSKWDAIFNPCVRSDLAKPLGFNKYKKFSCQNGNYLPQGGAVGQVLQKLVASSAESLLDRIDNNEFPDFDTRGLKDAIVINPSKETRRKSVGLALGAPVRSCPATPIGAQMSPPTSGRIAGKPQPVVTQGYTNRINGQVVTYAGDPAQYVRQDVTELMRTQGLSGAGTDYRTSMLSGSNGQTYYVDTYPNGEARWYTRGPDGKGWSFYGAAGGDTKQTGAVPGTLVNNVQINPSTAYQGWNRVDVTEQMKKEGYNNFTASTQYTDAKTGMVHFLDDRADGSYMWSTRNADGSFTPRYGRDASGKTIGDYEWNAQTNSWQGRSPNSATSADTKPSFGNSASNGGQGALGGLGSNSVTTGAGGKVTPQSYAQAESMAQPVQDPQKMAQDWTNADFAYQPADTTKPSIVPSSGFFGEGKPSWPVYNVGGSGIINQRPTQTGVIDPPEQYQEAGNSVSGVLPPFYDPPEQYEEAGNSASGSQSPVYDPPQQNDEAQGF